MPMPPGGWNPGIPSGAGGRTYGEDYREPRGGDSLGQAYLRGNPRAAFFASLKGLPPFMQSYFQNQYDPIYGEYLGGLGENPSQNFPSFLGGQNFQNRFYSTPQRQRGFYPSQYSPRTRFLSF